MVVITKSNWDLVAYYGLNFYGLSPNMKQQRFFFVMFKCAFFKKILFYSERWLWYYRQHVGSVYVIWTILALINKFVICHSSYIKPERISLWLEKPRSLMSYLYSIDKGHSLPGTMGIYKLS